MSRSRPVRNPAGTAHGHATLHMDTTCTASPCATTRTPISSSRMRRSFSRSPSPNILSTGIPVSAACSYYRHGQATSRSQCDHRAAAFERLGLDNFFSSSRMRPRREARRLLELIACAGRWRVRCHFSSSWPTLRSAARPNFSAFSAIHWLVTRVISSSRPASSFSKACRKTSREASSASRKRAPQRSILSAA